MEALQVLLERLNTGKIPLSPEMLEQAGLASSGGPAGKYAASGKGAKVDHLMRRQNSERVELDRDLRKTEEKEIDSFMTEQVRFVTGRAPLANLIPL